MKKLLMVLLAVALSFALVGCDIINYAVGGTLATLGGDDISDISSTVSVKPIHSDLYIPGVSVEDVITYFNEVCLDAEYSEGGDSSLVQRWESPMYYYVDGAYTDKDMEMLEGFAQWLNTIDGFPGIYAAETPMQANVNIHFSTLQQMVDFLGNDFYTADGGVQYWYNSNIINKAVIYYRYDISQYTRNSVILEEIYNGIGATQDTSLRTDSIIYTGFSEPQTLTEIDELLLKILYHPQIKCGMNADQCEAVIREIYY